LAYRGLPQFKAQEGLPITQCTRWWGGDCSATIFSSWCSWDRDITPP